MMLQIEKSHSDAKMHVRRAAPITRCERVRVISNISFWRVRRFALLDANRRERSWWALFCLVTGHSTALSETICTV